MNVDTGKLDEAVAAVKAGRCRRPDEQASGRASSCSDWAATPTRRAWRPKKPEDFQKAIKLSRVGRDQPERQREVLPRRLGVAGARAEPAAGQELEVRRLRAAERTSTLVSTNMPGGGSVSPSGRQIMGAVPQAQQYIDAQTKRLCK
jgi:hypothetical protein